MPSEKSLKFSRNQIEEIASLFSNDNYRLMYQNFYNEANKEERKNAQDLREKILTITDDFLDGKDRSLDEESSKRLIKYISEYRDKSSFERITSNAQKKDTKNLEKATKTLIDIVDRFSTHIFQYDSTDHTKFAPALLRMTSDKQVQKDFKDLKAYTILAKHLLDKTDYSISEQEALNQALGKIPSKDDPAYSLENVYMHLSDLYNRVIKTDLVKNAAKTNYLKTAGIHGKNVGNAILVAFGISVIVSSTTLAGAPTASPSFSAVMRFLGEQILPAAGIATLATSAVAAVRGVVINRNMSRVREQIRQIDNKDELFKLIKNNTPDKNNKLNDCIKRFLEQSKKAGFELNLGRFSKRKNFKLLLETENLSSENIDQYDRTLHKLNKRKSKIEKKKRERNGNKETRANLNKTLGDLLSPKNPLCSILEIQGQKQAVARSKKVPSHDEETIITRSVTIPVLAREKESVAPIETTTPLETSASVDTISKLKEELYSNVGNVLNKDALIEKSLLFDIEERKFKIHIEKIDYKNTKKDFEIIMSDIQEQLAQMINSPQVEEQTKLKYSKGVNVTITPLSKNGKGK